MKCPACTDSIMEFGLAMKEVPDNAGRYVVELWTCPQCHLEWTLGDIIDYILGAIKDLRGKTR